MATQLPTSGTFLSDNARAAIDKMVYTRAMTHNVWWNILYPRAKKADFPEYDTIQIRPTAGNTNVRTIGNYSPVIPQESGSYVNLSVADALWGASYSVSGIAKTRNMAAGNDAKFDYAKETMDAFFEDLVEDYKSILTDGDGGTYGSSTIGRSIYGVKDFLPPTESAANSYTYLGLPYSGNAWHKPSYLKGNEGPTQNANADWLERFQRVKEVGRVMRGGKGQKQATAKYPTVGVANAAIVRGLNALIGDKTQYQPMTGTNMRDVGVDHECIVIAGIKIYADEDTEDGVIRFFNPEDFVWNYSGVKDVPGASMWNPFIFKQDDVHGRATVMAVTPRWQFYHRDPGACVVMTDFVINA
jgi:hypothetical protein